MTEEYRSWATPGSKEHWPTSGTTSVAEPLQDTEGSRSRTSTGTREGDKLGRVPASLWEVLAAVDFFTVEAWSWGRLTRYHVFFVSRLATRRVHTGIIPEPYGKWMRQVGRT